MKTIGTVVLVLTIAGAGFLLGGCGSGNENGEALSGTFVCDEHWNEALVGRLHLSFRSDGTFSMAPMGGDGTYEVSDSVVTITNNLFENGFDLQIDGDRLVAPSDMGDIVYVKQ
jgi:hypothetical protein